MTDHSLERDPALVATAVGNAPLDAGNTSLAYESGLEVEPLSQWTYARRRFMRHRLAVVSLFVLVTILLAGALAPWVAGAKEWVAQGSGNEAFVFFISGAKERAPAAAQEFLRQLGWKPDEVDAR